ncbi:PEPxxWA-CTERM sorting domain-containing protein [Sphingomonas sp. LR60]|uniref:PEPxxWA-CTERM sorting domain-containing protein n=1 Tax=Sphingomonas sp. LR60 TaxID=3050233 RepID=UPI002FE1CB63
MKMMKVLLAASALLAVSPASAAPIIGSFSLASFSGTYTGGTAATATGLDFGDAFGGAGNGFGVNGSALVGNAKGSFTGLNGMIASIADIALIGNVANSYLQNPFIQFGSASNIIFSFDNASVTRSPLGTSVTITGMGTFSNGIAADATAGTFSLATSSQNGMSSDVNFTFTSNASAGAVPEPATWAMMLVGFAMVGAAVRKRRSTVTAFA